MIAAGTSATNPRSGTEFTFLDISETGFVLQFVTPEPRGVPDVARHYHVGWAEEFRMIEGAGHYVLGK